MVGRVWRNNSYARGLICYRGALQTLEVSAIGNGSGELPFCLVPMNLNVILMIRRIQYDLLICNEEFSFRSVDPGSLDSFFNEKLAGFLNVSNINPIA